MIAVAGILIIVFSILVLMAAAMSDDPYAGNAAAGSALIGLGIGAALVVLQVVVLIVEKYHG